MSNTPEVLSEKSISLFDIFSQNQNRDLNPINLTLGNPNLKPPAIYYKTMRETVHELENSEWNSHGYIIEDDPFGLCRKIAQNLKKVFNVPFSGNDVCMTVGATGAIDVILKTVLENSHENSDKKCKNEVIVIAPYFVEYINLIKGNGGIPVIVNSTEDYGIDIHSVERAISPFTKTIIVNSPNNPTGRVYSNNELHRLAEVLKKKNEELKISIRVIEDSVYDTILFNKKSIASLISHYSLLFRVNSYSKSMSLSGERIGYYAIHPNIGNNEFRKNLQSILRLNMRMRVVHAPLFQQRILSRIPIDCVIDTNYYKNNIDMLYNCITELGYKALKPEGTFYLWATLPDRYNSEEQFRKEAMQGNTPLYYLPGVLFGGSAYKNCIRFSVCVSNEVIVRACLRLKEIDTCFPPV